MGKVRRLDGGREEEVAVSLEDLGSRGARRMIAAAQEAEVDAYVTAFIGEVDDE